ncbi:hypothetical protein [Candidatus Enterococcus clewellii]|uniref:Uncharacterized protein n=1 Tax=Candidatus Enterococcus clewellii TaxID=1834193 RepID=A0AAQ3Y1A9_9ENTE
MNRDRIIFASAFVLSIIFLIVVPVPDYIQYFYMSIFFYVTAYLLIIKKKSDLLSIPITKPLTDAGKNILLINGFIVVLAATILLVVGLVTLLN